IELGIAWCNGYTPSEVAALSLFSHGPALFLLHYFYNAPATSSLISLTITILSTTVPVALIPKRSVPVALIPPPASKRRAAASAEKEAPEADCGVQVLTTLLAACIHSIVLASSRSTHLKFHLPPPPHSPLGQRSAVLHPRALDFSIINHETGVRRRQLGPWGTCEV
ncbi:hypothetical protein V495_02966, partial [Pseudogymnoascus sp. VKM F-4514 (FW-929)]